MRRKELTFHALIAIFYLCNVNHLNHKHNTMNRFFCLHIGEVDSLRKEKSVISLMLCQKQNSHAVVELRKQLVRLVLETERSEAAPGSCSDCQEAGYTES